MKEPLLFLEHVEQYCLLTTDEKRFQKAIDIVNKFIRIGSIHELNLSQEVRNGIVLVTRKSKSSHLGQYGGACKCDDDVRSTNRDDNKDEYGNDDEDDDEKSSSGCGESDDRTVIEIVGCDQLVLNRQSAPLHFFDRLLSHIMVELKEDSYPRFISSDYYGHCLEPEQAVSPTITSLDEETDEEEDDDDETEDTLSSRSQVEQKTKATHAKLLRLKHEKKIELAFFSTVNNKDSNSSTTSHTASFSLSVGGGSGTSSPVALMSCPSSLSPLRPTNSFLTAFYATHTNNTTPDVSTMVDEESDIVSESTVVDDMSRRDEEYGFNVSSQYFEPYEIEKVKNWSTSTKQICNTEWKLNTKKKGVVAYTSKKSIVMNRRARPLKVWKLVGEVPYSVDQVFRAACCSELRIKHDSNLISVKYLNTFKQANSPYATSLTIEEHKFFGLSNRRFIFCTTVHEEAIEENGWKRIVVTRKCLQDHELAPPSKSVVTGEVTGGWVFEQANEENTKTRYYEVGTIDIKGSVPKWFLNFYISSRGTAFHDGLTKSLSEYAKKTRVDDVRYGELLDHYRQHMNSKVS